MSWATDAGDSGLLLPVSAVLALLAWIYHSGHLARLMLVTVAGSSFVVAVLKLFFLSCGAHWVAGIASPSGHACLSATVFGMAGALVARDRARALRVAIAVAVFAAVAVVAVSRVALGMHSALEVAVGLAVGGCAQWYFAHAYARMEPLRLDAKVIGVSALATAMLAYGVHFPAESLLRHMARRVGERCPVAANAPAPAPAAQTPVRLRAP